MKKNKDDGTFGPKWCKTIVEDTWMFVEGLLLILGPYKAATKLLEGDMATMVRVLPVLRSVKKALENKNLFDELIQKYKKQICNEFTQANIDCEIDHLQNVQKYLYKFKLRFVSDQVDLWASVSMLNPYIAGTSLLRLNDCYSPADIEKSKEVLCDLLLDMIDEDDSILPERGGSNTTMMTTLESQFAGRPSENGSPMSNLMVNKSAINRLMSRRGSSTVVFRDRVDNKKTKCKMEVDKYMHYVQNRMQTIVDNNIYRSEDGNKFNQNNFDMECALMDNDLLWWKNNSSQFPLMKHLARKYLSVPATSCASERAASTSGNVVTNYRTRLLPENVNESCVT